ncbi:hypothetical protein ACEPAG_3999 [Sanghuangporus baumii]
MADTQLPQLPPPPPPGTNFIAAIRPSLNFILVATPLGGMLLPVIILLFVFSTPVSRKAPVFILNVIACLLGLLVAFMNGVLEVKEILQPTVPVPQAMFIATIASTLMTPMFVDSILLTRVIAFYPRRTSILTDRLRAIALPIAIKIARFVTVVLYLSNFTQQSKNLGNVLLVGEMTWFRDHYIIIEWTLQVVDNSYSSLFFLYKLRLFDAAGREGWIVRHPTTLKRIRGLFYIALGNFVFPVILNVAQIVLITTDRSFLDGSYVMFVNDYISILGVVFATIWTTSSHWSQKKFGSTGSTWNQEDTGGSNSVNGSKNRADAHTVKLPTRSPNSTGSSASQKNELLDNRKQNTCPSIPDDIELDSVTDRSMKA